MNAPGAASVSPHARRNILNLPEQDRANLIEVNQVHAKRLLLADALSVAVGRDTARIFAMREPEVMLTGIAESTISEVLSGKRKLNRTQIGKLARYFHVSPAVFEFGG